MIKNCYVGNGWCYKNQCYNLPKLRVGPMWELLGKSFTRHTVPTNLELLVSKSFIQTLIIKMCQMYIVNMNTIAKPKTTDLTPILIIHR